MQEGRWCTIVVPCFNEARRLRSEAFLTFAERNPSVHFLFVDDGSTDETLVVLRALCARAPDRMRVLEGKRNRGKGEAVRRGMLEAMEDSRAEYVGFWDADLATPLSAIPLLLAAFEHDPEIEMVFGSRVQMLGREVRRKASRHYLGRVFASVVSVMLGLPIYDSQCGAKIFRTTPQLHALLQEPFISRWVFDVEVLARFIVQHRGELSKVHCLIYEYPLPQWEDISGSKVKPHDFFRAFMDISAIRRRYLRRLSLTRPKKSTRRA